MDPTFATISGRYDFMTRVMSFGQEQRWKAKAVSLIPKLGNETRMLDLASGTGDFLLHIRNAGFRAPIIALDRSPKMVEVSRQKCAAQPNIEFIRADLLEIPFKDQSFDAITMGYGLRYVADIRHTLREIHRLLAPGGIFVCMDFGVPKFGLYRRLCFGYLLLLGTLWGLLLHRKANTYWHIVESLRSYPGQRVVKAWLEEVGFGEIEMREQLGGINVIFSATRR
jgi:ubiquinone/menaquinone biosynthesis methyltransferase